MKTLPLTTDALLNVLQSLPDDIAALARLVRQDWAKPYFGAVPYLDAMASLHLVTDAHYQDSAHEIILRFLVNAKTWRGPVAKAVKAKLNALVKP